jgi:uncharacterized protein with NRDE domain
VCLIGIALNASAAYPIVVAANRDEQHARPTRAAHWWADDANILAGRDLQAGGTWLGVTRTGRIAAVTNIYLPERPSGALSRGQLVSGFLSGTMAAAEYSDQVLERRAEYSPFNLLLGAGKSVHYVNHAGESRVLASGIHALSNAPIGDDWPKTLRMRTGLQAALLGEEPREALFALLREGFEQTSPDNNRAGLFIRGTEFGTRSSTVISISAGRMLDFTERQFDAEGILRNEAHFRVSLSG